MTKHKALGKGLSALIPEASELESNEQDYFQCPIAAIEPNPYQPRLKFDTVELDELAESVKEKGVITPLLVTKEGNGYRLIAGERRWRAAQKAGLTRVPVVVRETTPMESLELALIENIHRQDLNPIEEALAYQRWLMDSNTTQETLAKKVGKNRSTITNMLRLLKLPEIIREDLVDSRLTTGHARVLVGLETEEEQKQVRDVIIKKALSVRQTEALLQKRKIIKQPKQEKTDEDYYFKSLELNIKKALGVNVEIKKNGRKGRIQLHFNSDEEFDRLLDILT